MALRLVDHPLAQHLLTILRDQTTDTLQFRHASRTLATVLMLEATRDLPLAPQPISTPLTTTDGTRLARGITVVPVLRAGLGLLQASLDLFPDVTVGYLGLERNEETAAASSYYRKLPKLANRVTFCVDPMLATGGSACQALHVLKEAGAVDLHYVCVLAAPEGLALLQAEHPDVDIYTAAVDSHLNDKKYIVPGLGDYGDRLFGTL